MMKEQIEYLEFWGKLSQRAHETQQDFGNLSFSNQQRISTEVASLLQARSVQEVISLINHFTKQ